MSAELARAAEPAPPANESDMRQALAWATDTPAAQQDADKNSWVWAWEALQGDFKQDRSTGQIAFDAGVSMIPVVDQLCDLRDLIANCRVLAAADEKTDTSAAWLALALTLVGLVPTLGSLLKGVLKIMFTFVRRHGVAQLDKAIDLSMTWVITFLRKKEVQDALRHLKVDEPFKWLAKGVRVLQGRVNAATLIAAFDRGISTLKGLQDKVRWLPLVARHVQITLDMVERVRRLAPQPLAKVDEALQKVLAAIARRLDMEQLLQRHGILNVTNVHFRGGLPEARAVTLMRQADPPPSWLSRGEAKWAEADLNSWQRIVDERSGKNLPTDARDAAAARGDLWPVMNEVNIRSFHRFEGVTLTGPVRLFRVVSPSNAAMGDCWVPEDVWSKILQSSDPKAAWRKYSAVWPDWNPNGQFVVLEIPAGKNLNVWRGPASSQEKKSLDGMHLEGGWDQVIFKPNVSGYDTIDYYKRGEADRASLHAPISRDEWEKLDASKKEEYVPIRKKINHPEIRGPFDTGWGSTDFDVQLNDVKIGIPKLAGQVTN